MNAGTTQTAATTNGKGAPASALELLLGGFDREEFFGDYWEKRSFVIHHEDPDRFTHLMSRDQFMDEEIYHCQRLRGAYLDPEGWPSEVLIRPGQAAKVFESGMTIGATMLREEGEMKAFLDSCREGLFGVGPHFNAYYSPDKKGYSVHFDAHPVWFMQIEGRKHWYIGRKPVFRNPPMTLGFPPDRNVLILPWITVNKPELDNPEQFMSVTLEPGDVVYMPPGTWHQASARGYSLALTLASARISAIELLFSVVQHSLSAPEFKVLAERIGGMAAAARTEDGRLSGDIENLLEERLAIIKELVSRIEVENLRRIFEHLAKTPTSEQQMLVREKST